MVSPIGIQKKDNRHNAMSVTYIYINSLNPYNDHKVDFTGDEKTKAQTSVLLDVETKTQRSKVIGSGTQR